MAEILYLDQNAWVSLAKGAWDKGRYPEDYARLVKIVEACKQNRFIVPLSFANIYETHKISDPIRRANIARTQVTISNGRVFRSRRRILGETLTSYLAAKFEIAYTPSEEHWFLSDLWFEATADFSPESRGFERSDRIIEYMRSSPAHALFEYLTFNNQDVRFESIKRFTASSADVVAGIEARRALTASEPFALRKRAYRAQLMIDELDFILETGRKLGLDWTDVQSIGSSLARSITADVPILATETELAVRLEDQDRRLTENDLRDMSAFTKVIPLANIVVGENAFINIARQARLGENYGTQLLTSIDEL